jgi:hypothetical protein
MSDDPAYGKVELGITIGLGALIAILLVLYAIVAVETFVDLVADA